MDVSKNAHLKIDFGFILDVKGTSFHPRTSRKRSVPTGKPLIKLFGDKTRDEISNSMLFCHKQRILLWKFEIERKPGEENYFSDATSRQPVGNFNPVNDRNENNMDHSLVATYKPSIDVIRAIALEMVEAETTNG